MSGPADELKAYKEGNRVDLEAMHKRAVDALPSIIDPTLREVLESRILRTSLAITKLKNRAAGEGAGKSWADVARSTRKRKSRKRSTRKRKSRKRSARKRKSRKRSARKR
tara:strand:+ start:323 stop:652 length:330 start_codon:yes stop_codon:yes gene_type:complete